jgi:small nuclear ribonucleoprotein (snRNP)-like protein
MFYLGTIKNKMLFFSFFKTMVGKEVVIELKNDLCIQGQLHSVDQYLNMKLHDITVPDVERFPHMLSVKNCFVRGSVVRYVHLPVEGVDTALLQVFIPHFSFLIEKPLGLKNKKNTKDFEIYK